MIVDFSKIDLHDLPMLIIKDASENPIGVLGNASGVAADIKYNETSELNFEYPAFDGESETPYYDDIVGMRIIELQDIGQFILMNPKESGDGKKLSKSCKAYSLEYEFTFKKITLPSGTYNFWNPVAQDETILSIILERMPSWRVGSIDSSLVGKYRTFDVSNENLYNFIKNTLQESYGCIFEFDTYRRVINVRAVTSSVSVMPVYLSTDNLVSEITIEEDTESIVTQLDVNGADGVDIRDVNPTGNNKIINLDYYMTTANFPQSTIDKYYAWKSIYRQYQIPYYNKSIEYSLEMMRKTTESAALTDLEGELSNLENQQAVAIQAIAQLQDTQDTLNAINAQIAVKQNEISDKKAVISQISNKMQSILSELAEINEITSFEGAFTPNEYIAVDRFIKEDSISESSFVVQETSLYNQEGKGCKITEESVSISNAQVSSVDNYGTGRLFEIRNGSITVSESVTASIIRCVIDVSNDGTYLLTAYLGRGTIDGEKFDQSCLTISGTCSTTSNSKGSFSSSGVSGYLYLTFDTSEYAKRAVSWDLFEYGNDVLEKLSQPSFHFELTSANCLHSEDFVDFKNVLRHGEKIYLSLPDEKVLSPIVVGLKLEYDASQHLSLEFSDKYTSGDSSFKLADLLEQSVSMGKSVDTGKYTYSAFVDSGANTQVKEFMTSALDVAKNAIMSSKNQAISWGDSGIRLRKWTDESKTSYEPHQVWMNNNSILMTSNNWNTAEIAIGHFKDSNLGDLWGIVAPNIVGTLLAGSNLVIESAKKDGDTSVFRVDAAGAFLYNADLNLVSNQAQISISPSRYLAVGKYPLYSTDDDGNEVFNQDNANFWVDTNGDVHMSGTLYACDGTFSGELSAATGTFKGELSAATGSFKGEISGGSININDVFKVSSTGVLTATSADIKGVINATSMKINGNNVLTNTSNGFATNLSKISSQYLDLGNITLNGVTGDITLSGNIYITGDIQWNSANSPVQVMYSDVGIGTPATSPTYWHTTLYWYDLYASYSYDGGVTWTNAVQVRGINGADGTDGEDGTDAYVTATNVFNALTSNGTIFGCFSDEFGRLYINSSYIKTDYLSLGGGFGYISFGLGSTGVNSTYGVQLVDSTGCNYLIATDAGVRMNSEGYGQNGYAWTDFYLIPDSIVASEEILISSDRRIKNDISYEMDKYEQFFMNLKPAFYKLNNGSSGRFHVGFIAQDVECALIDAGMTTQDFSGLCIDRSDSKNAYNLENMYRLRYTNFISLNTFMIQKLYERVAELETQLTELKENTNG